MNKKIYRATSNKEFFGVCAGIADYFNIDPFIVRLLWVVYGTITGPIAILVYIACIFILPLEG